MGSSAMRRMGSSSFVDEPKEKIPLDVPYLTSADEISSPLGGLVKQYTQAGSKPSKKISPARRSHWTVDGRGFDV